MEVLGKIHSISETQNVTDTFSKREFIVETQEEYKQYLQLQVTKDKCAVLDSYNVGDNVNVSLNLRGRLWTNKDGKEIAFNTLECWKISKEASTPNEPFEPAGKLNEEEHDDLPW